MSVCSVLYSKEPRQPCCDLGAIIGAIAKGAGGKSYGPVGKLTNTEVKQAKAKEKAWRLQDGGNMYMEVSPKGEKRWYLKYRYQGKEKRLSLGVFSAVSLKDAREGADKARGLLANGIDPL